MFFAQFCVYITGGTNSNVGRRRSKRGRIDKKKMSCLLGKVINHCDAFFFQYNIAVFRYFRSGGGFFFFTSFVTQVDLFRFSTRHNKTHPNMSTILKKK